MKNQRQSDPIVNKEQVVHAEKTQKPVGLKGVEYRKAWNKLNKDRMRAASRRYLEQHPERKRKIPKEVVERYRKNRRKGDKPKYYAGWENATNRKQEWTSEDTLLLLGFKGTDRELSGLIGRSIAAIQQRRCRLRQATENESDDTDGIERYGDACERANPPTVANSPASDPPAS
jgi:hypothetical protein